MSDEASIVGKGREILLPPEGNPFDKSTKDEGSVALEEPRTLSPDEVAERFGEAARAPEPTDLGPDEVAALFPSSPADRNMVPGAARDSEPAGWPAGRPAARYPEAGETGAAGAPPPPAGAPAPAAAVGFEPYNPFRPAPGGSAPGAPVTAVAPVRAAAPPAEAAPEAAAPDEEGDVLQVMRPVEAGVRIAADRYPLPPVAEEEAMVGRLVTDERIEALWRRIEAAELLAVGDANSAPARREANLEELRAARNLLLGGRKNFEDAQRYVVEVESDLFYAGRVRRWSYTYGLLILFYAIGWLGLLVWGYASARALAAYFAGTGVVDPSFGFAVWVTMLSGGLGGVSKSLFALASHVSKRDFDRQHLMWYFTSPLIGAVLGIFVFMTSWVGIVAIGAGGSGNNNAGFLVYIFAWVVGFQQNLVLELVERVKKVLLTSEDQKEKPTGRPSPAGSAPPPRDEG